MLLLKISISFFRIQSWLFYVSFPVVYCSWQLTVDLFLLFLFLRSAYFSTLRCETRRINGDDGDGGDVCCVLLSWQPGYSTTFSLLWPALSRSKSVLCWCSFCKQHLACDTASFSKGSLDLFAFGVGMLKVAAVVITFNMFYIVKNNF